MIMNYWINVKDRLPNIGSRVDVWTVEDSLHGSRMIDLIFKEDDKYYWDFDACFIGEVTHWMYSPQRPK